VYFGTAEDTQYALLVLSGLLLLLVIELLRIIRDKAYFDANDIGTTHVGGFSLVLNESFVCLVVVMMMVMMVHVAMP